MAIVNLRQKNFYVKFAAPGVAMDGSWLTRLPKPEIDDGLADLKSLTT